MPKKPATDYERWREEAAAVQATENPLKVPYDVFLKEATQAASFMQTYWEPTAERPGLSSVKARLPLKTAEEIRSLVTAVQEAQTKLVLLVDPVVVDHGERARFVLDELESTIEFVLDDDVEEVADAQLAHIQKVRSQDGHRSTALAQALYHYAALAGELEARLVAADASFDRSLIDEARKLSNDLVMVRVSGPAVALAEEAQEVKLVRNRMLVLLTDRVGLVRRTAAHVFRRFPEIVREVTSAYDRRRRAARRAKLVESKKDQPQ